MEVKHINNLIFKLSAVEKPLTVAQCKKLAVWIREWVSLHDNQLLQDVFLRVKGGESK